MSLPTPAKDAYLELAAKTPFAEKKSLLWFMKVVICVLVLALVSGVFRVYDMQSDNFMYILAVIVTLFIPFMFVVLFSQIKHDEKMSKVLVAYCKEYVENKLSCNVDPLRPSRDGIVPFRLNSVVLLFDANTENILLRDGSALSSDTLNFYQSLFEKLNQQ